MENTRLPNFYLLSWIGSSICGSLDCSADRNVQREMCSFKQTAPKTIWAWRLVKFKFHLCTCNCQGKNPWALPFSAPGKMQSLQRGKHLLQSALANFSSSFQSNLSLFFLSFTMPLWWQNQVSNSLLLVGYIFHAGVRLMLDMWHQVTWVAQNCHIMGQCRTAKPTQETVDTCGQLAFTYICTWGIWL